LDCRCYVLVGLHLVDLPIQLSINIWLAALSRN